MEKILKEVCKYYKISTDDIKKKNRYRFNVRARQMFYLLMFENRHDVPISATAKFLGQTHATAIHGIKIMNYEINLYPQYRKDYIILNEKIKNIFRPKNKYYERSNLRYCNPCIYVCS